jgi:hypothetical protein
LASIVLTLPQPGPDRVGFLSEHGLMLGAVAWKYLLYASQPDVNLPDES